MAPAVSVVVATHRRAERLRALLESLVAQRAGDFEVVVVADGAGAEVLEVLATPPAGLALRVERHARARGPAAARNTGWRAAAAPLVAFTDDDCVASPAWLEGLLEVAGADDLIVQGRVEPLPAERDRIGPFTRTLHVGGAGPFFQTANILYPRALLERLRGFDESYPHPAGEDTDLGWRARELGARAVFAERALVWHAVHELGPGALVRDAPRWGSAVRIVKRHPRLREHFVHRIFWKPSHERLVGALAGLALARVTRGLSLALVVRYALSHRDEHPSAASLVRALPAHLAVDGAELAALARGSVEQRTLLL